MELKKSYTMDDLFEIMRILRGENGCPWDRAQTHESIKKSLIEECYEAIDALDKGDDRAFANELGDVLLQVVFHAAIAKERNAFCFDDILYELCTKLITRHTHVFGADNATTADEALSAWEKNKKKEKQHESYTALLEDVPHGFPALLRAQKVQKKAASVGFDWENTDGVWDKLEEEIEELKNAATDEEREEEFGDLLFTVVNLGRHMGFDCETAMGSATAKFIDRFSAMEKAANAENKPLDTLSLAEMDAFWVKNKQKV